MTCQFGWFPPKYALIKVFYLGAIPNQAYLIMHQGLYCSPDSQAVRSVGVCDFIVFVKIFDIGAPEAYYYI